MKLPFYQVDAFTDEVFSGNPAGVCPLRVWLPDAIMQKIAAENNLAETAFFIPRDEGYEIRWFTPLVEVDLCGHATLASAHIIYQQPGKKDDIIRFHSRSGELMVKKTGEMITMDFPADFCDPANPPAGLFEALGVEPVLCYRGRTDFMLIYENEEIITSIRPDFARLGKIDARGVIVSAPGNEADFVSRFFAPQVCVNEDPVTGSAHTTLTPYWSRRLVKSNLTAIQLSERGGELKLRMAGNRVEISGHAVIYLDGQIEIPG
jgi:PhzF family phenazine biosynthesis protein